MKFCLILLASLSAVSAQGLFGGFVPKLPTLSSRPLFGQLSNIPLLHNVQDFGDFVAKTGKNYATAAERSLREGIFKANEALIDSHNKAFELGQSTFKLGANIFADLSIPEFLSKVTGLKRSSKGDAKAQEHRQPAVVPDANVPDSFDWREKGGVTPVKFQGLECNSCWSFAVTGAVEGHHFRKTNALVPLSEQNLIDCSSDFGNVGCGGGYQEYGFEYIIQNKGVAKSEPYPYKMKDDKCSYRSNIKGADMKAFAVIEPGDEQKMKEVIATLGPLACSMNAGVESFVLYKEGIYDDEECNKGEVNHSILVVGYGSENGQDYWIIKNSWTDKWGEGGYAKIPRNKNSFCGIASECSYPLL